MSKKLNILDYIDDFVISPIRYDTDVSYFKSDGGDIYTSFLTNNAKNTDASKITKTYLFQKKSANNEIYGYFAILTDSIEISRDIRPKDIPEFMTLAGAIQIYQLAASEKCVKKYNHIVEYIVRNVKAIVLSLRNRINIRYITLYADEECGNKNIVKIYEKAGFKHFPNSSSPETVLMFYDIGSN